MSENETAKIRVAMVDDHEMFRAGVIATLRDSLLPPTGSGKLSLRSSMRKRCSRSSACSG